MPTTTDEFTAVQTIRLLVVEDDDAIRDGYPLLCELRGWEFFEAATVADALRRIADETDLSACVLDLRLGRQPDGGLAVLEAFQRKFPDAPVVLLTGGGASVERAVYRGAAMVVRKPAAADHLLTVVGGLIETRQMLGNPADRLERQLDQLERYINALGVGVVILDRGGVIRLLNHTMTNEVGVPPEAVGQEWVVVMGGQYFGDLKVTEREDFPQTNEVTYCARHYLVTTRVCEEPTGSDFLLIQTWLDITKRKKAVDLLGRLPSLATQPPLILANELVKEVCGIGYPRAYLYLREPAGEGNPLRCLAAFADGRPLSLSDDQLPPGDPFVKRAEKEMRVIRLTSAEVEKLLHQALPESRRKLDGVTGMLKVPLFADGVFVAILCVEIVDGWPPFGTEDVELMELLSRGLSAALAASLRIPSSLAQARWALPAREINATLSDGGEVTAVLRDVLQHTAAALGADYAWLLLQDERPAAGTLSLRAQWSNECVTVDTERLREYRHRRDVGITGRALRTRRLQVVPDLQTDPDFLAYYEIIRNQPWLEEPSRQLRSTVVMPVFRGDEPVGVLGLYFIDAFHPTPVDEEHLAQVSRLVAVALRRMGDTAAIISKAAQHAKIADLMLLGSGVAHALRNQLVPRPS